MDIRDLGKPSTARKMDCVVGRTDCKHWISGGKCELASIELSLLEPNPWNRLLCSGFELCMISQPCGICGSRGRPKQYMHGDMVCPACFRVLCYKDGCTNLTLKDLLNRAQASLELEIRVEEARKMRICRRGRCN